MNPDTLPPERLDNLAVAFGELGDAIRRTAGNGEAVLVCLAPGDHTNYQFVWVPAFHVLVGGSAYPTIETGRGLFVVNMTDTAAMTIDTATSYPHPGYVAEKLGVAMNKQTTTLAGCVMAGLVNLDEENRRSLIRAWDEFIPGGGSGLRRWDVEAIRSAVR